MSTITNDKQLRQQFDLLDIHQQRLVAAQFIMSVVYLNTDRQIQKAVDLVESTDCNEKELERAFKQIKSLATRTYTDCGSDTDWKQQAAHFVATAMAACLTPENQLIRGKSLAWKTAMQARMAKNCEMIEKDSADVDNESIKQYLIVEQFSRK